MGVFCITNGRGLATPANTGDDDLEEQGAAVRVAALQVAWEAFGHTLKRRKHSGRKREFFGAQLCMTDLGIRRKALLLKDWRIVEERPEALFWRRR
jgi:hypothetical protein